MDRIGLAAIQPPFLEEKGWTANQQIINAGLGLLEEALSKGMAFACLPEYFNVFGVIDEPMSQVCANHDAVLTRTAALAAKYRSYVILPMVVQHNEHYYNRALVIDDSGAVLGWYDKTHLTIAEKDQLGLTAGNELKTFATKYGRIAVVICYDVYFPELFAGLCSSAVDIVFFPSVQRSEHELASAAILRTRAMDTQAYIVRAGYGQKLELPWRKDMMFGQSCVVHPDGTILANAGHYEGWAIAQAAVPFVWRRQRCSGYPAESVRGFLAEDRRDDLYHL